MAETQEPATLTEEEQTRVGLEWFLAMWNEATYRGVGNEQLGIVCISATAQKLIEIFGSEHAATLFQVTSEKISSGEISIQTSDAN